MMGGLAYMTGRPGDPLRAGSSVNDIMGGMFGAIATLGALIQRGITGRGMEVQIGAVREQRVPDGPAHAAVRDHRRAIRRRCRRAISPWAIYDVFTVKDGEQIFLAAVSDAQWLTFCDALGFDDLKADPALKRQQRARPCCGRTLLAELARAARQRTAPPSSPRRMERAGLPFAPIRKPEELLDDPHLTATGGLADVRLPDGEQAPGSTVKTTLFPFTMAGERLGVRTESTQARRTHARRAGRDRLAESEIDASDRSPRGGLTHERLSQPMETTR